jgi:sensor c-di-GMP phosphodiesterase-like protein
MKARHELENDIRHALSRHAFELHYQSIVSLRTNRVTGCEALLRWHDSERGSRHPSLFLWRRRAALLFSSASGSCGKRAGCRRVARGQEGRR